MTCGLGKQQLAGSVLSPFPLPQVDIYIMTQPLSGKWLYYGTEVTSGSGRLTFTIPPDKALAIGIYPVRMVVRCGAAACCWQGRLGHLLLQLTGQKSGG